MSAQNQTLRLSPAAFSRGIGMEQDWEYQGLELAPMWGAGIIGHGFILQATTPVPEASFTTQSHTTSMKFLKC